MKKILLLILSFSSIISCNNNAKQHPNFNELPTDEEISYSLDLKSDRTISISKILKVENINAVSTITKDTLDVNLFGIRDLKLDPDGNIYFTKAGSPSIFVYSTDGDLQYTIGRQGKGPGELLNAIAFGFNDSFDKLIVLDQNEIEVYSYDKKKFSYDYTIYPKTFMAKDLCILNNTIYHTGFKYEELDSLVNEDKPYNTRILKSGPIHKYDLENNNYVGFFGPTYHSYSGWWLLDAQLSNMKLACNKKTNTIVGVLYNFGYFYAYESDGTLKSISKLDNFKYATLIERNINTPQISYKASAGAKFSPTRITNTEYSVFQIINDSSEPLEIVLNTRNGELLHGGSALPSMFGANNNNYLVKINLDLETVDRSTNIELFKLNQN